MKNGEPMALLVKAGHEVKQRMAWRNNINDNM